MSKKRKISTAEGRRPLFDVDVGVKIGIISVARKIGKTFVLEKIAALRKKGITRNVCGRSKRRVLKFCERRDDNDDNVERSAIYSKSRALTVDLLSTTLDKGTVTLFCCVLLR